MTPDELALLVEDACIDGWVTVPSSTTDKAYRLTVVHDWPEACTCPGYAGHGHCHHLDEAREVWLRTVPVGVVMTPKNEALALRVHHILDQAAPYPEKDPGCEVILWLHQPLSNHETKVGFARKGQAVEVTVAEDFPGAPPPVAVEVPYGHRMPLPALRRLMDFPPSRRILWEFLTTGLTGLVVEMPKPWAP